VDFLAEIIYRLKNSLTGRILVNAGWATAATPISAVLGIVQVGMMARMLGPTGIGTITLFSAVCALFSSIFKITSSETVMVYSSKAESSGSRQDLAHSIRFCFIVDGISSFLAYGFVVIAAFYVPKLLNLSSKMVGLQVVYGLTIIFDSTFWTAHGILRFTDRFSWTFFHQCFHSMFKTILVGILYIWGYGLDEVVWTLVGISFLNGIILIGLSLWSIHERGVYLKDDIQPWYKIPSEVWHYLVSGHIRQIVKSLSRYADNLVIGFLGNPLQVGYYRAGKQVSEQIYIPVQGFVTSLFPEYSRLYFAGERRALRRIVMRFSTIFIGGAALFCTVFWFISETVIRVVFGQAFLPANDVVRVLVISATLTFTMIPLYSLPAATGNAGPALKAAAAAVCVQLTAIFILVPRYGVVGAAWANVAYSIVWVLVLIPSILSILHKADEKPVIS
jgi:O-antigen/teichoic acid export membrane protein